MVVFQKWRWPHVHCPSKGIPVDKHANDTVVHLLLQTRVRTLNGELSAIFKRWYPDMDLEVEEMPVAA